MFQVQGSAPDPYEVRFIRSVEALNAFCSCPAGTYGTYCKHRLAIMSGDSSRVVSENAREVEVVQLWLKETPLAEALHELAEAERELKRARRRVTSAKRRVSEAMG